MRCKICDSILNNPTWNILLQDWEVCGVCLEIINNVFEDPVIPEETEEDPLEDELFDLEYGVHTGEMEVVVARSNIGKTILLDNLST